MLFFQFRLIFNLEGSICLAFPHPCRLPWSWLFVLGSRVEAGRSFRAGSSVHSCGVQILSTGFVVSLDNQYGHWNIQEHDTAPPLLLTAHESGATAGKACSSRQKHVSFRRKDLTPSFHPSFRNGYLLVTWETECNGTKGRTYHYGIREWFQQRPSVKTIMKLHVQ
jgi:hypothetical protein